MNLALMRRIDEQYLKSPWYGSRQMTRYLKRQRCCVGRKRSRRLRRLMAIVAIYPGPQTSRRHPKHPVFPYLLRNVSVTHANQVWCTDVTYIPMSHGFIYLLAIVGWHTRHVLSWRLWTTQDTSFCLEALEEAVEKHGAPDLLNTDQGSQFTSSPWVSELNRQESKISMDGKGCWTDHVFIERLWRSLKYECLYLNAYDTIREARQGIADWITYYNQERPHSSLGDQTPEETYQKLAV